MGENNTFTSTRVESFHFAAEKGAAPAVYSCPFAKKVSAGAVRLAGKAAVAQLNSESLS